jgi:ATP synthase protein I
MEKDRRGDGAVPPAAGSGSNADADLARRLGRLSSSLDAGQREQAAAAAPRRSDTKGYALALRLASEFVAGIVVGAAIGWGLDALAGTTPWAMIGFLLLGFAAGVVNVIRAAERMTSAETKPDTGRHED